MPKKEKKWVYIAFILGLVILCFGVWDLTHAYKLKAAFKSYGSNARIGMFLAISYVVFSLMIKKKVFGASEKIKKMIILLLKWSRKWHIPISIITIALIAIHAVGAFLYGIKIDFSNISGLLALVALLPVPISGLMRHKKMDRVWHMRCGIAFFVLFLVHAFL
ncbi:hypothetical protein [Paenibacillus sp. KN14-4R]|uniref:hypothetical protein n=1 Tax=Paenibacillus sp. KN14-4R TaxID=3445773 RepID=UPI003FA12C8A